MNSLHSSKHGFSYSKYNKPEELLLHILENESHVPVSLSGEEIRTEMGWP